MAAPQAFDRPLIFATPLICGDRPAKFGIAGNALAFEIGGVRYLLREAGKRRYVGISAKVVFLSRGTSGTFIRADGKRLECSKRR